jgi:hypothetical protein
MTVTPTPTIPQIGNGVARYIMSIAWIFRSVRSSSARSRGLSGVIDINQKGLWHSRRRSAPPCHRQMANRGAFTYACPKRPRRSGPLALQMNLLDHVRFLCRQLTLHWLSLSAQSAL